MSIPLTAGPPERTEGAIGAEAAGRAETAAAARGAEAGEPAGAAGAGTAKAVGADVAGAETPLAAGVGNLIAGAPVGLGGKLIRTVSFFGWTLAASAGLGGTAPDGKLGMFSAIFSAPTLESTTGSVKSLSSVFFSQLVRVKCQSTE
jgi:hypothetical protein